MKRNFNIGKCNIEFQEKFINYNNLRKRFLELSMEAYEKFMVLYRNNCLNIDDVHNKTYELGCNCISQHMDEAISIMISYGVMHIDRDGFIDEYYSNFFTWEEDFEKVDGRYREIVFTADEEKAYREERKATRGRWQGGGFGLSGAIGGAMQAGGMNAVTGAAHSAFNFVGNMVTSVGVNSKKEKLFEDESLLNTLAEGVMNNVFNIHYAVVEALIQNGNKAIDIYPNNKTIEVSKALLNNLKTGLIPQDKESEIIEQVIFNYPYNKDIYIYLLKKFGDENRAIEEITKLLDLDIQDEKEYLIEEYYRGLSKETEAETIEALEAFKKFSKSINFEDDLKYIEEFKCILKQHDISIRTIDGILFETREESEVASLEFKEILEIRETVIANSEQAIKDAIYKIKLQEYKTIIQEKHLKELEEELKIAIRVEDQMFLDDNHGILSIVTEGEADKEIQELEGLVLRSMDLVEKRIEEVKEKRELIIEEVDNKFVEDYFNGLVMLNERDIEREVNNIRNLDIRTAKVKDEKANYVLLKAEKIIKKHNSLLEKALKYEVRITSVKVEKKIEKKGVLGFISKAIDKGANIIDEIQEKSERDAWEFITNNGKRTIESIMNK